MLIRAVRMMVAPARFEPLVERALDGIVEPRGAAGMTGYAVHVRRETSELLETSVWETPEALAASESAAIRARTGAMEVERDLRILDVARSELLWQDRRSRREPPAFSRLDIGSLASGRLDAFVAFIRDALAPGLTGLVGYESILVTGERTTEIVVVRTDWRTAEDRAAANSAFVPVVRHGADYGLRPIGIQLWERIC